MSSSTEKNATSHIISLLNKKSILDIRNTFWKTKRLKAKTCVRNQQTCVYLVQWLNYSSDSVNGWQQQTSTWRHELVFLGSVVTTRYKEREGDCERHKSFSYWTSSSGRNSLICFMRYAFSSLNCSSSWRSFWNFDRNSTSLSLFRNKISRIGRGLFGLATNTCRRRNKMSHD